MNHRIVCALAVATLLASACATTKTPPAPPAPRGEERFLVDPRIGYTKKTEPAVERRFETAWRSFLAGDYTEARKQLADLRRRNPEYLPAALAEVAVQIREGDFVAGRNAVLRIEDQMPDYTAARIYEAELDLAQDRTRAAYAIYQALARDANAPPVVAERLRMLQSRLFDELISGAQTSRDDDAAIEMLREALTIRSDATNARVLLANRLIHRKAFDEARRTLDPLTGTVAFAKPEVQEALAEIEVGRGQYQEAIARYERLARVNPDPRYSRRLDQIKEQWNEANLPPQYQRAFETDSITRADLAVLIYWKLASIRFAQNLNTPPIAIDIEGVPGREEIIRAIAIGLFDVDTVTRRVSPLRTVTAAGLARHAARLLTLRGADCARVVPPDRDDITRASKVLAACGISDPSASHASDAPISGREAAALLDELDRVLPH